MENKDQVKFPIISADDWKRSIRESRARPNYVSEQIRNKLMQLKNLPEDLAGYQHIKEGKVDIGDILVSGPVREKYFVDAGHALYGWDIASLKDDIYRKIACPKASDSDKNWFNISNDEYEPLGSLKRFPSGSLRGDKKGKGRFDLIPYEPVRQLAVHFEVGGANHGDRNWELGQPLSTYINSAKRHAMQAGSLKDENHAIASCWNFFCLIQTAKWIEEGKLPKELDDINWIDSNKK